MNLKISISTALLLAATVITAQAQDQIYLRDGGTIQAKVKEVGERTVTYKKYDNQEGPDFVIGRRKVEGITYEDGSEEQWKNNRDDDRDEHARPRRNAKMATGMNIISLAPIQMTDQSVAGFGLQYERMIDKHQMLSFYLPFAASFRREENYNNGYDRTTRAFYYFYPGVKIYPGGANRRVSYGVGPSLAIGFGDKYVYDYNSPSGPYSRLKTVVKSGLMLTNSLNIMPTNHLFIGMDFGLGFLYVDEEEDYYNFGDSPIVQFSFKMGYRF